MIRTENLIMSGQTSRKKKKNNKKVVTFRNRQFHINIGIVIFALILIYFAVNVISYTLSKHVASYEVQYGEISDSNAYTQV